MKNSLIVFLVSQMIFILGSNAQNEMDLLLFGKANKIERSCASCNFYKERVLDISQKVQFYFWVASLIAFLFQRALFHK